MERKPKNLIFILNYAALSSSWKEFAEPLPPHLPLLWKEKRGGVSLSWRSQEPETSPERRQPRKRPFPRLC